MKTRKCLVIPHRRWFVLLLSMLIKGNCCSTHTRAHALYTHTHTHTQSRPIFCLQIKIRRLDGPFIEWRRVSGLIDWNSVDLSYINSLPWSSVELQGSRLDTADNEPLILRTETCCCWCRWCCECHHIVQTCYSVSIDLVGRADNVWPLSRCRKKVKLLLMKEYHDTWLPHPVCKCIRVTRMKLWQIFSFLTNIMTTCEYQKAGIAQSG